jgi:hypothetical protein
MTNDWTVGHEADRTRINDRTHTGAMKKTYRSTAMIAFMVLLVSRTLPTAGDVDAAEPSTP